MKYKDYYGILGVDKKADEATIKKAYRKLARKYHPDVSKDPKGEEKFKEVAEAYETVGDKEKRAAYDQLGNYKPGQEFRPPPDWGRQYGDSHFSFDNIDLSDLFAGLRGGTGMGGGPRGAGGRRAGMPRHGQDFEISAPISLQDAFEGTMLDLNLGMPEHDERRQVRRIDRSFKARIPKGATDGQRLRLPGKGGKGVNGGKDGDLYLNVTLNPHPLFRVSGHDLYVDLPVAPWEAVQGASVEVPTLGGTVRLKIPPGSQTGQKLRLAKRGLPRPRDAGEGDLFAIIQIVVPAAPTEREKALFKQLAEASAFDPRSHFRPGGSK